MSEPLIAPDSAAQIRAGFNLPSVRAAALRPLALAPYDDIRDLCLRLETQAVPDEHVALAALAGFLTGEGCHYAALTCQTAQYAPHLRPDFYGLWVRMSAFQRYVRDLAGIDPDEARAVDRDDRQADRFEVTVSNVRDMTSDRREMSRAEACERYPTLAALFQDLTLDSLAVSLDGDELTAAPIEAKATA